MSAPLRQTFSKLLHRQCADNYLSMMRIKPSLCVLGPSTKKLHPQSLVFLTRPHCVVLTDLEFLLPLLLKYWEDRHPLPCLTCNCSKLPIETAVSTLQARNLNTNEMGMCSRCPGLRTPLFDPELQFSPDNGIAFLPSHCEASSLVYLALQLSLLSRPNGDSRQRKKLGLLTVLILLFIEL